MLACFVGLDVRPLAPPPRMMNFMRSGLERVLRVLLRFCHSTVWYRYPIGVRQVIPTVVATVQQQSREGADY